MTDGATAVPIAGGFVVKRTPGRTHKTFEEAGGEAARLTQQEGAAFYVLQIVGVAAGGEGRANG